MRRDFSFRCVLRRFRAEDKLFLFADEHHAEAYQKQSAGYPDRLLAESPGNKAADTRADGKDQYDREICKRLFEYRLILCAKIGAESLSAASHIADAHRTGIGMAAHLMECLHLKRADERDERIRERIELLRHESDRKQQNYLINKNQLPPVDFLVVFEPHMHHFRYRDADDKRHNGDEIFDDPASVRVDKSRAHEHDVSRLRICKDRAAAAISIGILKSAGEYYEHRRAEFVRHLSVKSVFELHADTRPLDLSAVSLSMLTSFVQSASTRTARVISSTVANDGASLIFLSSGSSPCG